MFFTSPRADWTFRRRRVIECHYATHRPRQKKSLFSYSGLEDCYLSPSARPENPCFSVCVCVCVCVCLYMCVSMFNIYTIISARRSMSNAPSWTSLITEGQDESVGLKFFGKTAEQAVSLTPRSFISPPVFILQLFFLSRTHSWPTKPPTVIFKGHKDVRLPSTGLTQAFLQRFYSV